MTEKKITFDSFARGTIYVILACAAICLIDWLSGVLLPFFIAWLIAYMIYPIVIFFQKKLHFKSRVLSIIVVMLLAIGALVGAFWLLIPPMVQEIATLNDFLTNYIQGNYHTTIPGLIEHFVKKNIDLHALSKMITGDNIMNACKTVLPQLWSFLYQSVNIIFSIVASFIVLLYVFFILKDYEKLSEGWIQMIPAKHQPLILGILKDAEQNLNSYFRGQTLIAFCVGILFSIGFLIIDFPVAIGLGLFIGVLNLVPYLQLIGFIPTILLALLKAANTGENFWWIMFCALLVFCIVQLIQDFVLTPKIMGKASGLNPAIMLLSLSIWGYILGMIGMIIAIPLTTLLKSYYKQYVVHLNKRDIENEICIKEMEKGPEKETKTNKTGK